MLWFLFSFSFNFNSFSFFASEIFSNWSRALVRHVRAGIGTVFPLREFFHFFFFFTIIMLIVEKKFVDMLFLFLFQLKFASVPSNNRSRVRVLVPDILFSSFWTPFLCLSSFFYEYFSLFSLLVSYTRWRWLLISIFNVRPG